MSLFILDDEALAKAIDSGRIAGTAMKETYGMDISITADEPALDAFFAVEAPALFSKKVGTLTRAP